MGIDSVIAFAKGVMKWVTRVSVGLYRLVIGGPRRTLSLIRNLRSTSPVTAALAVLAIALAATVGAGLFFAAQASTNSLSGSSAPILSGVLEWMTSGWGYVISAFILGRGSLWGIRRRFIEKSADESGYKPRDIERLSEEIRTTNDTTRVLAFADDSADGLADRIREAFDGAADETLRFGVAPDHDANTEADTLPIPVREQEQGVETYSSNQEVEQGPTRAERFALWRKDLASSLRSDSLIWRFLVPAVLIFGAELIIAQFWVIWWLYPVMVAGAILGGLVIWRGTLSWRRRRLTALREERSGDIYDDISVLVKAVETDDLTVYMGFLAGRRYASRHPDQLAETLATRALDRCEGKQPAPAIEERWAWCLDRYIVDFEGWRENREKPAIMDQLVTEVLDAEECMLPKQVLAHRVVEHDREYIWQGMRFVGYGFDPRLVAEAYEELTPSALVEREIEINRPDEETTITAVRARTEALPPDVAQVRANFSERFPTRKLPDRYALPAPDRREETEPFLLPK